MNITLSDLQNINVEQNPDYNRQQLELMGGISSLLLKLNVSTRKGLSEVQVLEYRNLFGSNEFPLTLRTSFLSLIWAALSDTTLLILMAAAVVSLTFGIWQDPKEGWVDGAAILFAVCIVTIVSSVNDYTKELQFQELEASSQLDERCSVVRNKVVSRVNPADLVVGDIIVLQVFVCLTVFTM